MREVLLLTHHETPPARRDVEGGVDLSGAAFDSASDETGRHRFLKSSILRESSSRVIGNTGLGISKQAQQLKRGIRAINNPINSGRGRFFDSSCSTFTYSMEDRYMGSNAYQVFATVQDINTACTNAWWVAILIIVIVLILVLGGTLIILQSKRNIFGSNGAPVDQEKGDTASAAPPPPRAPRAPTSGPLIPGVDPIIEVDEIAITEDEEHEPMPASKNTFHHDSAIESSTSPSTEDDDDEDEEEEDGEERDSDDEHF